jgi:hypothetical protein
MGRRKEHLPGPTVVPPKDTITRRDAKKAARACGEQIKQVQEALAGTPRWRRGDRRKLRARLAALDAAKYALRQLGGR